LLGTFIMLSKGEKEQYNIPIKAEKIQCPDCLEWSNVDEWESDVFCWDDCEEMVAMECPKCKETFERYSGVMFNYS